MTPSSKTCVENTKMERNEKEIYQKATTDVIGVGRQPFPPHKLCEQQEEVVIDLEDSHNVITMPIHVIRHPPISFFFTFSFVHRKQVFLLYQS